MKNIVLFCAGGMSSSLLVNRMREAATSIGYECRISAHSITSVKTLSQEADVVLIGPQVGYLIASVKNVVSCPSEIIISLNYGRMDGMKVLEQARALMGEI